jgi:hypothetical protein
LVNRVGIECYNLSFYRFQALDYVEIPCSVRKYGAVKIDACHDIHYCPSNYEALLFLGLGQPFRAWWARASPIFSASASVDHRIKLTNVLAQRLSCDFTQVGNERLAQLSAM